MSSGNKAKETKSEAGKIVGDLRGPLTGRLGSILSPAGDDPYFQRQVQLGTQKMRGAYGARGLANSGISVQGEQDLIRDLTLGRDEAQANRAINILQAGSGNPVVTQQQPRGFMGLK